MTLESLQYVYGAYKFGSYKEAAFALSVSYSVVAKQVSRVEEELGVKLFERASKSKEMNLTLAGEALIGEIKTILKSYEKMQNSIDSLGRDRRKRLRIGYGQYLPCEEEISILAMFNKKYPDIALSQKEASPEDLGKQLAAGLLNGIFVALLGSNAYQRAEVLYPPEEYEMDQVRVNCGFHFLMSEKNPLVKCEYFDKKDRDLLLGQTIIITNTADSERKKVPPYLSNYLGTSKQQMKVRFLDSSNLPLLPLILQDGDYIYPTARRFTRELDNIKGIPVVDWEIPVYLYFICSKESDNPSLSLFRQCVKEYSDKSK